MSMMVRLIAE
jgi:mannose-6-phosphate isomerase-like protein (cupin superfamily)